MREFVYFSGKATTTGNFKDLMKAGRLDISIHVIIASFFLSHSFREDVKLHLVFYGMPNPPKHITIEIKPELEISKKDVAGLLKRILYKYNKKNENKEVFPGCKIEKKSFLNVINELINKKKTIFILDKRGEDIRDIKTEEIKNAVFVLGDHDGLPKKEFKRLKKSCNLVSVGPKVYFASQTVAVLNNELDRRGL